MLFNLFNAEVVIPAMEEGECDVLGDDDTEAESCPDSVCEELEDISSSSEASSDAGHSSAGDPTELEELGF